MNYIYDNGELLLGTKRDIIEYQARLVKAQLIEKEDYDEIVETLQDKKEDTIVCINYDNGMGLSFDFWENEDKLNYDLY